MKKDSKKEKKKLSRTQGDDSNFERSFTIQGNNSLFTLSRYIHVILITLYIINPCFNVVKDATNNEKFSQTNALAFQDYELIVVIVLPLYTIMCVSKYSNIHV